MPAVQATHAPLMQTPPELEPHCVASAWNVVSVQTGAPLLQLIAAAVAHGFVLEHASPAVHAPHASGGFDVGPLHTPAAPPDVVQAVPAGKPAPSMQTAVPDEQSIDAVVMQGPLGGHDAPWVHAMHVEELPLQTPGAPVVVVHPIPADRSSPSLHTADPVVQSIDAPTTHGPLGEHEAPCVHRLHWLAGGPLHTAPGMPMQAEPAGTGVPSTQTGAPVEQSIDALVMQAPLGVQAAPWVHWTHDAAEPSQTPAAPDTVVHAVPAAFGAPSLHAGPPPEQSMVALLMHGPLGVHDAPCVHCTQSLDVPLQTPGCPIVSVHAVPALL